MERKPNKLNDQLFKIGKLLHNNTDILTILRDDYLLLHKQLEDIENTLIDARITAQQDTTFADNMEANTQEIKAGLMK